MPGQELCALVGLALWNLRLCRGFERERPPELLPEPKPRCPVVEDRLPPGWPRDPVILRELGGLPWKYLLCPRPGWRWEPDAQTLMCEAGRPMSLTTVRSAEHAPGQTGVIFRRPTGGCEACEARPRCLVSDREGASKHLEFSVTTRKAGPLRDRLSLVRGYGAAATVLNAIPVPPFGAREN